MGPQTKSCAEFAAGGDLAAEFEGRIEAVAGAAGGCYTAIEQRRVVARHGFLDVEFVVGAGHAARRRDVDVRVDQAGQQRLARTLHDIGAEAAGVGNGAIVDIDDFAVVHEHAGVLLDRAIAEEHARVFDEERAGALEIAHDGGVLADVLLGVGANAAHDQEGREHAGHPKLVAGREFLLFFPAEELHGEEKADGGSEEERTHRRGIIEIAEQAPIAEEDALEAGDQVSGRHEFPHRLRPGGQNRRGDGGAAQKEHRHVKHLDEDVGLRHGVGDGGEDQAQRAKRAHADRGHQDERNPVLRHRHAVDEVGEAGDERDDRQVKQQPARHGRHQDGQRRNGRDFEAAQDVGLALLHAAHAGAPQAVAHDAHGEDGADEIGDALAGAGVKHFGEREKENQREQVIEEQHAAIASGEQHVAPE